MDGRSTDEIPILANKGREGLLYAAVTNPTPNRSQLIQVLFKHKALVTKSVLTQARSPCRQKHRLSSPLELRCQQDANKMPSGRALLYAADRNSDIL